MAINRIKGIYFSPAGSTREVVALMAERLSERLGVPCELASYTLPHEREAWQPIAADELVVWGSPVYAGRLPNKMLDFVRSHIMGQGNMAVPVALFGGRNYDNAVSEMCQILREGGMVPVAAAAVVARHVFSQTLQQGRPNEADREEIRAFCDRISLQPHDGLAVPGEGLQAPYYVPKKEDGTPAKFLKALPQFAADRCEGCGRCAESCPTGCLSMREGRPMAEGVCIKCQACVRICPAKAVAFADADFLSHVRMLEKNFSNPASNTFWE